MSLYKALKLEITERNEQDIKDSFLAVLETITDKPTKADVIALVQLYAEYSVQYLRVVAATLEPQLKMEGGMKFMNSLIAECTHLAGIHYYHRLDGYTIVDKPIQYILDNQELPDYDMMMNVIKDIEASYVEDEEEEEVE